jgi:hypothetical protein
LKVDIPYRFAAALKPPDTRLETACQIDKEAHPDHVDTHVNANAPTVRPKAAVKCKAKAKPKTKSVSTSVQSVIASVQPRFRKANKHVEPVASTGCGTSGEACAAVSPTRASKTPRSVTHPTHMRKPSVSPGFNDSQVVQDIIVRNASSISATPIRLKKAYSSPCSDDSVAEKKTRKPAPPSFGGGGGGDTKFDTQATHHNNENTRSNVSEYLSPSDCTNSGGIRNAQQGCSISVTNIVPKLAPAAVEVAGVKTPLRVFAPPSRQDVEKRTGAASQRRPDKTEE